MSGCRLQHWIAALALAVCVPAVPAVSGHGSRSGELFRREPSRAAAHAADAAAPALLGLGEVAAPAAAEEEQMLTGQDVLDAARVVAQEKAKEKAKFSETGQEERETPPRGSDVGETNTGQLPGAAVPLPGLPALALPLPGVPGAPPVNIPANVNETLKLIGNISTMVDGWFKEPRKAIWTVIKALTGSPVSVNDILANNGGGFANCKNFAGEKLPCRLEVFQSKDCFGTPNKTLQSFCLGDGEKIEGEKKVEPWQSLRVTGWCGKVTALTGFADPKESLGDDFLFDKWASQLEVRKTWEYWGPTANICPTGYVPDFYEGRTCISTACKTFRWDLIGSGVRGFDVSGMAAGSCAEIDCPKDKYNARGFGMHHCRNSTCNFEECCSLKRQCISIKCPPGMKSNGDAVMCRRDPCVQAECCKPAAMLENRTAANGTAAANHSAATTQSIAVAVLAHVTAAANHSKATTDNTTATAI